MKYSLSKRTVALLLSIVMMVTMLPAVRTTAATVQVNSQIVDGNTMNSWQSFFDPTNITTAHAGGVWTDKSVFKDNSAFGGMTVGNNNFLVALSAMGSNSVVVGQDYAPTDTMFVLDVSNSMSDSALSSMVTATNNAIRTLLEGENNTNRVGVVLYGTTASVLLPLDHYTGVEIGGVETFIQMNGNSIRAAQNSVWVPEEGSGSSGSSGNPWEDFWESIFGGGNQGNGEYVTTYLTNQAGNAVTTSVSTGGGTYTQSGMWKAWQEFDSATAVSTDKASVKRAPVMVLMCDGAATYSAADFDNVPNSATHGTGSASSTGDGFVTQLTAAFVKAKMAEKYGTGAFLYTLGLDVEDIAIAQAILDPANRTAATDIDDAWTAFLQGSATVSMYRRSQGGSNQNVTITNDTATTLQSAFTSESYKYADKYFSASQVTDLNQQFQNIVNEISLSAGYYPTHLDDNGANYSGYITFVDELGEGMEVKEIEGIVIGDNTYTGKFFARALASGLFGTKQEPTAMGNEFVWAVKARLGLTDNDEIWALLDYAYNTRRSLHYTSDSDWSNYIVWYGDANGEYLGYDEELESIAAYRNACYGMLGAPDGTHQTTDMMYVGIQVSTNLSTGDQTVTFRVPAAMLPVVTYQINIDGNAVTENTTATLTYKAADPIRLVYEVGVKEEVTALNVKDYAEEIGGKFYLYTNKWDESPNLTNISTNHLTYAYFEPGADNEHYYFTEDAVIYTDRNKSGTVASAAALDVNGTYYYEHYVFNQPVANADGTFTVKADFHVEQLSQDALTEAKTKAVVVDGKLCVPEGTMHYAHSHNLYKGAADSSATSATANHTETFDHARYQIVDASLNSQASGTSAKHYELMYLGNNGRLTVNPATGISITKQVDDTITDVNATYVFNIDFSVVSVPDGTYNGVQVTNNKATVTLKAGETVYIYDLPVGAVYTITERYGDGYKQSAAAGAGGTVAANTVQGAVFTNTKRGTGSLTIEKDVTGHPFTTSQIESVDFDFVVELIKEDNTPYSGDVDVIKSGDTALTKLTFVNGKATFTLHDNQELTLINLPEGTTYTVYEVDASGNAVAINGTPKSGYKLVSVAGQTTQNTATDTIAADALKYAHFVNRYVATAATFPLKVAITKKLEGTTWPAEEKFQFKVERLNTDGQTYTAVTDDTAFIWSNNLQDLVVDLSAQQYSAVGNYTYRITEVAGNTTGATYDSSRGLFIVKVTDTNMDGILEIDVDTAASSNVEVVEPNGTAGHIVKKTFTNIYHVDATTATFKIKKNLTNTTGIDIPLTDFHFGLYSNPACTDAYKLGTYTTGALGDAEISMHITDRGEKKYYLKEIAGNVKGMTYDPTIYEVVINTIDSGAQLVSTVSIKEYVDASTQNPVAGTTAVFSNTYTAQSVNVTLSGEKTLEGRDWLTGEKFIAELYKTDATFHYSGNPDDTKEMTKGQKYTFDLGNFSQVGIYHYVVKEQIPGGAVGGKLKGITYDATEYHVTVTVALDDTVTTEAKLKADVTVIKLGNGVVAQTALDFKNTYHAVATDDVQLGGTKVFENTTPGVPVGTTIALKKDEFRFNLEVKDAAGNVIATGSAKNDVNGNFLFDKIHFTKAGVYTATITEVNGGIDYITYAQPQTVTITIADNTEGKLTASATGGYLVQMKNTYKAAETKLGLTGIKELVGAEGTNRPLQANEFSFTLMPVGAAPMPSGVASVTVKNGADGKFAFSDITFDAVGTYQYTITEEKETDGTNGIYYDKVEYTVTVTVTDHGAGKLVAEVTSIIADATTKHVIDFYNSYYAKTVEVILSGNKVLENVTPGIAAADKNIPLTGENFTKFPFSFVLEAVTEGAPMPSQATVSSGNNGAITFGAITFDAVGEYKYTVKELIPANSTNGVLNGVTYTVQTHHITITVTDNKLGQLVASVALEGNDKAFEADGKTAKVLSFKNTFTPKDTSAQITVEKDLQNLCGKPMGLDGFRFQLTDAAGNKIVKESDAQGLAKFVLTFSAEDAGKTYVYKLTEVDTEVEGVQYSDAEYEIRMAVTKDAVTGELSAAVTVMKDGKAHTGDPVFVNYYDLDTTPETGDTARLTQMRLCMGISGVALLAVLVLGKKKLFAAE